MFLFISRFIATGNHTLQTEERDDESAYGIPPHWNVYPPSDAEMDVEPVQLCRNLLEGKYMQRYLVRFERFCEMAEPS